MDPTKAPQFWKPGTVNPGSHLDRTSEKEHGNSLVCFPRTHQSLEGQKQGLPIYFHRLQLLYLIEKHQVVILSGSTGSGKTTQLPQYLFEVGWGKDGRMIGCTQPRRIAVTSVAGRVAEEMRVSLGQEVGYCIRFEDVSSSVTAIKYMTDGVLIRELMMDPLLSKYSVIILDEAHERSLCTDLLLGLLKKILIQRKSFRVVVSSATLDVEELVKYFQFRRKDEPKKDPNCCAVLSVDRKPYTVDIHYSIQPVKDYVMSTIETICDIHENEPVGDILAFLTGQEEVEFVVSTLQEKYPSKQNYKSKVVVYPLYASLRPAEQERIFSRLPPNTRKIIIATNVAETSITIPNIGYIVDCGFVKIPIYSPQNGMESLGVVPISQATAAQRSGRAGRVRCGKAYRLYCEEYFQNSMAPKSVPEIQRSNLCLIILQLKALGIDNIVRFDFLSPPPASILLRAVEHMCALNAIDEEGQLTHPLGVRLAELPMDPMMGKVLLASESYGCVEEVLDILSMLQVQTIFTSFKSKEAISKRRSLSAREGDHLSYLNIYRAFIANGKSSKWCHQNFLNYQSLSRVVEIRQQISRYLKRYKIKSTSTNDTDAIRKCLTSGYFAYSAQLSPDGAYRTVRDQTPIHIHPTSILYGESPAPRWVIFHELQHTTEAFMKDITVIEAEWLPEIAPHFYEYSSRVNKANFMESKKQKLL